MTMIRMLGTEGREDDAVLAAKVIAVSLAVSAVVWVDVGLLGLRLLDSLTSKTS